MPPRPPTRLRPFAGRTGAQSPANGGVALAAVIRDLSQRASGAVERPILIGVVTDSRPTTLAVHLIGHDDAVEVTAADFFDLFPLENGDVVVCVQLFNGSWTIVARLTGAELSVSDALVSEGGLPIAPGSVTAESFEPGAVDAAALADGSVTNPKLAANSVDASKIVDGSVGVNEIATDAVTTIKILDGAVTNAKLAGSIDLTTKVTGALPIANGGTGQTTAKAARETGLGSVGYYSSATHSAGTTITITQATHGLRAARGLLVQVRDETTGVAEYPDVTVASSGDVTVTYSASVAANSKRVTVIG